MRQLADDEIDAVLVGNGIGVLSLVDGAVPYAIPMSFGYDGEEAMIPIQLGAGYDGRKKRCIRDNPNACLTVCERGDDSSHVWRSVVVTGKIQRVGEEDIERAFAAMAANAQFTQDFSVWDVPFEEVELELHQLIPEAYSGREFSIDGNE